MHTSRFGENCKSEADNIHQVFHQNYSLHKEQSHRHFQGNDKLLVLHHKKPVIFGIRPENILVSNGDPNSGYEMQIERTEQTGSDLYVHLRYNKERIIARLSPDIPVLTGNKIRIRFEERKGHFFDPETGKTIT